MEIKFLQMKRALRSVLLVLLLTVVGMTNAKAQTPYRQYADNGVLLDFHEIDNVDFRVFLLYNLSQDDRFILVSNEDSGQFSIVANDENDEEESAGFFDAFESFYQNAYVDFGLLSKTDLVDLMPLWKSAILPTDFVSVMMDVSLRNSRSDNNHCVNSQFFSPDEIVQFEAASTPQTANQLEGTTFDDGCIISSYNPSWFHLRISTSGQFILHMEGRAPNNSNTLRDIDFCMWGPFDDPTTPCVSQLTSNKIIDCSYSASYTEDAYLGYPESEHQHNVSHGTVNYHVPQTGEYYILMITNYSQMPCTITFSKKENFPILFADANVKALCVANWDTNDDGELSHAEAAAVTTLGNVFYNKSFITSFNELQYFTGLTSINEQAFYNCTNLTSITVPNSVNSIGNFAFYFCSRLTSITIPDSVTSIESYAFYYCTGLRTITIPNSVTSIGNNAFQNCSGLGSITIPNSLTSIGSFVFQNCSGLSSIMIPNSVTSIGNNAFQNCNSLTQIELPGSITNIGNSAFSGCSGLTMLISNATTPPSLGNNTFNNVDKTIPVYVPSGTVNAYRAASGWSEFYNIIDIESAISFADANVKALCVNPETGWDTNGDGELSYAEAAIVTSLGEVFRNKSITSFDELQYFIRLESIGNSAFYNCSGLTSIMIPNTVTSIGNYAFRYCSGLTSITIPNSVTSIGYDAFGYCTGLTSLTIPNSVTSIGNNAFGYCTGLTSVEIPNSVSAIGTNPFSGCSGLEQIAVVSGNPFYDSRDNCNAIISTSSNALVTGCKNTIIPNSVTSIGDYAFASCSGLTSIAIPNSVTSIGYDAFRYCTGLTSIAAFSDTPPTLANNAFYGVLITIPVYVPCSEVMTYQAAEGWNSFLNITGMCSGVVSVTINPSGGGTVTGAGYYTGGEICVLTAIPNSGFVFGNWTENERVVSVDSVFAFYAHPTTLVAHFCSNSPISFADANVKALCVDPETGWDTDGDGELSYAEAASVTSLGEVFRNKSITSFDELTYFISLTSIGYSAFRYCNGLTSIAIPNSVTSIENYAFENCYGLTSIAIPNSVTSIGYDAFSSCAGLTSVVIPNSVTSIGGYAFSNCTGLTSIVIPNSVSSMGANPFYGCSDLEQIVVVSGNPFYDSRDNCNAIIRTNNNSLVSGCKNTVIPNSVTSIEGEAFASCTGLTSIAIPNSVTAVGDHAFSDCNGLTSLTMGNSVTSIGSDAFRYCTGLTSIEIPNSVTAIGNSAFYNCNGLASIIVLSDNPPTLGGNNVFYGINKSIPVYVPCASMLTYQYVMVWNEFSNYLPATTCTSGEITVTSNPTEGGTVTGAGYYDGGAICTLTAMANPGYAFINWTKDGVEVSNSATYSFTVSGDASIVANFEQGVVVIGSGTVTNEYLPSYSYYRYTLSQQIYTADEIGGGGSITGIAFYNGGATKTRGYDIYMVHTDKATFENNTDWIAVIEADRVFSGTVTMTANAWTMLQFDTPFLYNGISNIALVVDDNTGGYTNPPNMACRVFDANGNQAIRVYSDNPNYDPYNPLGYTGTLYAVKNQIKLQIEEPCDITFELYDSSGDGYTGNYLVVSYGNVTEQLTVESGSYASHTLQIPDGSHVELSWISGSWIGDCTFKISYSNGNALYYGQNLSGSFSDGFDVDCIGMPEILFDITATANPTEGGTVSIDGGWEEIFDFEDGIVPVSWSTSSDYPWQVVSSQYDYNGNYLCSGNSGVHNSNSSISTTVVYPADGNIGFHAICMGEGTYTYYWDHCDFYIDGIRQFYAGANIVGWNYYTFPVSAGEHTFTWSYSKDSSVHPTGDFFGIDNVIFACNSFNYGSTCMLTATPNPGYTFDNWTKNGTVVSTDPNYSFMVTENVAFVANFSLKIFHFITEGNWSISSNWEGGSLPEIFNEVFIDAPCQLDQNAIVANLTVTDGQSLTLQPGKKLTVTNTLNNTSTTSLIIEDGAQLAHASENVSALVKKTIPGHGTDKGKYRLISSPLGSIVNPELASIYHITRGNYDLYDWLPSAPDSLEWRNYKTNDFMMLPEGYGYLYANQNGMELNFPGILKPSHNRCAKSVSYDSGDTEHPGWNLIGNPFVCNAYLVDEEGTLLPYYRMNAAGNGFEAVAPGTPIAPMEGVFYVASESGTVYFTRNAPVDTSDERR